MAKQTSKLALSFHAPSAKQHVAFLRRHLRRAAALAASPLRNLSVAIVDDAEMTRVHDQFLGDPTTTDVVTFALAQDGSGNAIEGEIVICLDEAIRSAQARGIELRRELLLYGVHGILHLSGYDDLTPTGFRRMHAREDQLLSQMGLGKVFAAREKASASSDGPVEQKQ